MAVDLALKSFTLGQELFFPARERLVLLLPALEAAFGPLRKPGERPGTGVPVAQACRAMSRDPGDVSGVVERELRAVPLDS